MSTIRKTAILGGGNIGSAIATGLLTYGKMDPEDLIITRRKLHLLNALKEKGVMVTRDNLKAVEQAGIIILAVRPRQLEAVLTEISGMLTEQHILISLVTAFPITRIRKITGDKIPVIRAMPNTATAVGESVTALSSGGRELREMEIAGQLFNRIGRTYIIEEELMESAVVLNACGIAYFLRVIRAVMQGGIQIGFHAPEAQMIAAQVAKGAAGLLLDSGNHPESEIDKVTTPRGVTIAGLNEMEHNGMSSALIKGIVASFREIEMLSHEKTVGQE